MPAKPLYRGPIEVRSSPLDGFGVFATDAIRKGETIEECYTLSTTGRDPAFNNFYFQGKSGQDSALPLGFGSIYNHAPQPNAAYVYHPDKQIMVFTAERFIPRGEEICCHYGNNWFECRELVIKRMSLLRWLFLRSRIPLRTTAVCLGLSGLVMLLRHAGA